MTAPADLARNVEGPPQLLVRVDEAARMLSISRSVMFELIRANRIRSCKQGRTRLISTAALHEYVQQLESEVA